MTIARIPKTMLACQVVEVRPSLAWPLCDIPVCHRTDPFSQYGQPYAIHEIPTPETLGETDLLVKVAVASLCHTDSMVVDGVFGSKLPQVASHEVRSPSHREETPNCVMDLPRG